MTDLVTLNSLVKSECCNYVSDSCLGIDFSRKVFNTENVCFLLIKKKHRKPCRFFAISVLPLKLQLIEKYRKLTRDTQAESYKLRLCECGKEFLRKRERFCEKCRRKKERGSKRRYWHKQRSGTRELSGFCVS